MPIGSNYLQALGLSTAPDTMTVIPVAAGTPNERPAYSGNTGIYGTGLQGGLQHLGDAVKAPHMSGAFLRAGADLLSGGDLASAVRAGGGYVQQQEHSDAQAQQQATENALKQAGLNIDALRDQQNYALGLQNAGTNAARATEDGRHNRASEALDANGQGIQKYGIDTSAATQQRGQDISVRNNDADNATSRANNAASVDASKYGSGLNYLAATDTSVHGAGIGSKANGSTTTTTKIPAKAAGWFSGEAQPAQTVAVTTPNKPASGEIRYDAQGNAYTRDPVTGQPVLVKR